MLTIEKIDTSFMEENITAMDVAGFRLFLRHNIYDTIMEDISNEIKRKFDVIDIQYYNCSILMTVNSNIVDTHTCNYTIIDSIRNILSSKSNEVLYSINYDTTLSKRQKTAYKKILYSISESRIYFDILINISYSLPTIGISL